MANRFVTVSEATAARLTLTFFLTSSADGITPALNEGGGQPQLCMNGGAWQNTGISTLTVIGSGYYSATLHTNAVSGLGHIVLTRYKSANTIETPGDTLQVVGYNPYDSTVLGLTGLTATSGAVALLMLNNPSALATQASVNTIGTNVVTVSGITAAANATINTNLDATVSSRASTVLATAISGCVFADDVLQRATLDATVSSRLPSGGMAIAAQVNDKTGYALTTGERDSIASNIFKFDLSTITSEATRSLLNAIRFLLNKRSISGGTLTVYKENDSDVAYTATLTTDASQDPVVVIDHD